MFLLDEKGHHKKNKPAILVNLKKTRLVLNISDLRYLRPSPAKNRPINQTKSTKNKNTKISLCKYSRKRTYPYNSKFSADF